MVDLREGFDQLKTGLLFSSALSVKRKVIVQHRNRSLFVIGELEEYCIEIFHSKDSTPSVSLFRRAAVFFAEKNFATSLAKKPEGSFGAL